MARKFQRSPLALAILVLLHEAPMHPYRMQRLIKERGKDQVIKVGQRASLYQTITQLLNAGLITFWETEREEGFPERTVYKLTEAGRETALNWMREILSTPANEFPEFPAAISLLPLLTPDDVIKQMKLRETKLVARLAVVEDELQTANMPRLFLLESEYALVMLRTELEWVQKMIADVKSGELAWDQAWMKPFTPPDSD